MLSVAEAQTIVAETTSQGRTFSVRLVDSAGLVLAESIQAPHDSPPFDKAMMDGFAVATRDFVSADKEAVQLRIGDIIGAGRVSDTIVGNGQCAQIMTGAVLPPGADCVVPIERVSFPESHGERSVVEIPGSAVSPDGCIVRKGGIAAAGSRLIAAGTRIQAQQLAALAEFGIQRVCVYRRPEVAILATGDELVDFEEPLTRGKIRNSNGPMLEALVRQCGAIPVPLGIARDNADELAAAIQRGLEHDLLLLSGGVSAGEFDLVPKQLQAAGVRQIFHKVAMKPGKPVWFGSTQTPHTACLVFGLPGNPVSSLVCFQLFVTTALNRLSGVTPSVPAAVPGVLTEDAHARGDRPVYHPAELRFRGNGISVRPVPWNGSSDLRATVEANGMFLLNPPDRMQLNAGTSVDCIPWAPLNPPVVR
ncbi:MAG: molybdopterin molybdotransferase MoeA [Planctomycetaceae bacterium]|nr:molybdopterin molybdotransferase MoeA [Planctomycetaceae bacterium]